MATSYVDETLMSSKALTAAFGEEIFNRGHFAAADELVGPDFE